MAVAGIAGLAVGWAISIGVLGPVTGAHLPPDILTRVLVVFLRDFVTAIVIGAAIVLLVGLVLGPVAWARSRVRRAAPGPVSTVPPAVSLVDWLVLGSALGLAFAAALVPLDWQRGLRIAPVVVLLLGGTFTVAGALADQLWRGLAGRGRMDGPGPATTLRGNRTAALVSAVVVELTMIALLLSAGRSVSLGDVLVLAVIFSVFAVAAALAHPWPDYVLARCWLAMTGQLPLRLEMFLRAAHRHGVLLQVGSSYRFLQPTLRDRLASKGMSGAADAGRAQMRRCR
jgi:hypothetical protein